MSEATLQRIMSETSDRLAVARYGAETQDIGADHMRKMGVDLAEVTFTTLRAGQYTDAQINTVILSVLGRQDQAIIESFEAFGITENPFLERCRNAASGGFLDRAEVLFEAPEAGGRA